MHLSSNILGCLIYTKTYLKNYTQTGSVIFLAFFATLETKFFKIVVYENAIN